MLLNFLLHVIAVLTPFTIIGTFGVIFVEGKDFYIGESILINLFVYIMSLLAVLISVGLLGVVGMYIFGFIIDLQELLTNRIDLIKNKIALRSDKKL